MGKLIAVSLSENRGIDSTLDPRFGRAPFYAFIDAETGAAEVAANPFSQAPQGAGPSTAGFIRERGAAAVVSGRYGPKAQSSLEALGLEAWIAPEEISASEALRAFREGRLRRA